MDADKKYRGPIKKVILDYVKDQEQELRHAKKDRVFITHSGCDAEIVEAVREYLQSLNRFKKIVETRAGSVISSHCRFKTHAGQSGVHCRWGFLRTIR